MNDLQYLKVKKRNIDWLRQDLKDHQEILTTMKSLKDDELSGRAVEIAQEDVDNIRQKIINEIRS